MFTERGGQLGYITAERAPWIGSVIGRGEEVNAVFQSAGSTTAVIRVAIGGGEPALPVSASSVEPRQPAQAEADWYPDEEPYDDYSQVD